MSANAKRPRLSERTEPRQVFDLDSDEGFVEISPPPPPLRPQESAQAKSPMPSNKSRDVDSFEDIEWIDEASPQPRSPTEAPYVTAEKSDIPKKIFVPLEAPSVDTSFDKVLSNVQNELKPVEISSSFEAPEGSAPLRPLSPLKPPSPPRKIDLPSAISPIPIPESSSPPSPKHTSTRPQDSSKSGAESNIPRETLQDSEANIERFEEGLEGDEEELSSYADVNEDELSDYELEQRRKSKASGEAQAEREKDIVEIEDALSQQTSVHPFFVGHSGVDENLGSFLLH